MLSHCRIGAIVFFVRDLARTAAFYRDTLGIPVEAHDADYATAQLGDTSLVFIVREARSGESPVVVMDVGKGIDDYAEALARKGVEIVAPVSECPDGGLSVDFTDPDGNALSLYQPPDRPRRG